uniref:Uncharacterized protein n=1 Tax=Trichobilharzia regenti TaxID=157069 RepID=A0AA85IQM3_TRIRE|nr:unnamed protein product [Trichobilharzia regenti]
MRLSGKLKELWITYLAFKGVLFTCAYALILSILPLMVPGKPAKAAYVLLLMSGLWITEIIPIYVTGLIPMVLGPLLQLSYPSKISPAYTTDTNMLTLGGLLMACAVENNDVHKRIAISILRLFGSDPKMLLFGIMLPSWFLSMWMSNTATTAMMITIVDALLTNLTKIEEEDYLETDGGNELLQEERNTVQERTHNSYSQLNDAELSPDHVVRQSMSPKRLKEVLRMNAGLSLSISYASSVGGIATTVGTPPNTYLYGLIVSRYGDSTDLDFGTWMLFALPLSIIMFLIVWFWFSVLFFGPRNLLTFKQSERKKKIIVRVLDAEHEKLGSFKYCEGLTIILFTILTILWITRKSGTIGWGRFFVDKNDPKAISYVSDSSAAILMSIIVMIVPASHPVTLWKHWKHCYETKTEPNAVITRALLPWNVAVKRLPWGVIVVIGGGYALAVLVQDSGLSSNIGKYLGDHLKNVSVTVLSTVCIYAIAVFTEFMTNLAAVSIFLPIILSLVMAGVPLNIISGLVLLTAMSTYAVPLFGLNNKPSWMNNVR